MIKKTKFFRARSQVDREGKGIAAGGNGTWVDFGTETRSSETVSGTLRED
jgi:hypothetical protein